MDEKISDSNGNTEKGKTSSAGRFGVDWKWVVLFGAVLARVITTGTVVCMGVFLDDLKGAFPGVSTAWLSAVFSTATGLLEGLGVVCSILIKKFEGRYLVFIGAVIAFAGVLMASFTHSYIVLLACLGIANGLGQSLGRFVLPVAVGYIFDDKTRHIGLSITNAGDGVGGVVFPILLAALIDWLSWRNALLITAGFVLNLCISAATIPKGLLFKNAQDDSSNNSSKELNSKPDRGVEDNHSDAELTFGKDQSRTTVGLFPNIIFFYSNIICHSVGYFIFMTFIYSEMKESHIQPQVVSRVVSLIGGVSIIGRLSVSLMKSNDKVPRWLTYAFCHVIRGLSVLATIWAPTDVDSKVVWYSVICSVYGLSDGITGALIPVVCLDLFGLDRFATVLGWEMLVMGSGALLGVPIAGAMKDWFNSYQASFTFSGFSFVLSGLILLPLFLTRKHYQLQTDSGHPVQVRRKNDKEYQGGGISLVKIESKDVV